MVLDLLFYLWFWLTNFLHLNLELGLLFFVIIYHFLISFEIIFNCDNFCYQGFLLWVLLYQGDEILFLVILIPGFWLHFIRFLRFLLILSILLRLDFRPLVLHFLWIKIMHLLPFGIIPFEHRFVKCFIQVLLLLFQSRILVQYFC